MEHIIQITALAVVAAVLCTVVRPHSGTMALVLSLAGCVLILLLGLGLLAPVVEIVEKLQAMAGLASNATAPLLKIVAIGLLCQVASSVCKDAGESALSNAVELAGTALALYAASPLLLAVLDLFETVLGGGA